MAWEEWHSAWLAAHPHRTEEWLRERLRDGFDVHHLNGDKNDNGAANLVLIEHADHMALHNGGRHHMGRLRPNQCRRKKQEPADRGCRTRWDKTRLRMIRACKKRGDPIPDYLLT